MTSIRFTADSAGRSSFVIAIRNDAGWHILARFRHFRQHHAINGRSIKYRKAAKTGRQGEIRFMHFVVWCGWAR